MLCLLSISLTSLLQNYPSCKTRDITKPNFLLFFKASNTFYYFISLNSLSKDALELWISGSILCCSSSCWILNNSVIFILSPINFHIILLIDWALTTWNFCFMSLRNVKWDALHIQWCTEFFLTFRQDSYVVIFVRKWNSAIQDLNAHPVKMHMQSLPNIHLIDRFSMYLIYLLPLNFTSTS